MYLDNGVLRLSATDLANYLACKHLTALDVAAAEGMLQAPPPRGDLADLLRERGRRHEAAYVDHLRSQGLTVVDLRDRPLTSEAVSATRGAMAQGVDVIVQAPLVDERWAGRADILRKVASRGALGEGVYEVVDTKLTRETGGATILQLCAYSDIVRSLQGQTPERMHVVAPGQPFTEHTYRVGDFLAYYRLVRQHLEAAIGDGAAPTYPDPVPHCDVCRWWQACGARLRADDHPCLVAGISRLQIDALAQLGVTTLAGLGAFPLPLPRPARGSVEALTRAREQARVQLEGRLTARYVRELLPIAPGHGLSRLPAPSEGDVFLDIEGDPFVGTSGLEYLFGLAARDGTGVSYTGRWGLALEDERRAFEWLVEYLMRRWERYPDFHIYHYAPYEPAAMRRLMGKHGTCEDAVDRMLRADLFIDLYAVVRQGVLAGVEHYSIKNLEPFYGFRRALPLREASAHLQAVERLIELGDPWELPREVSDAVESYNRDDCLSAAALRDWLESLRVESEAAGQPVPRPQPRPAVPSDEFNERRAQVQALMERLVAGVPADITNRSPEQHACWLLAQLLEFHRREDKAVWWEFFRLAELPEEDRLDDPAALVGLEFVERVGGTAKCPIDRYRFPPQEFFASVGSDVVLDEDHRIGTLDAIDFGVRTVDIKKRSSAADIHPATVFFHQWINPQPLVDALLRIGHWVAAHGIDAPGPYRAVRDLLLQRPPRLKGGTGWTNPGEPLVDRARRLSLALDHSALPVQGPPGTGKTYVGARMVCALVRAGKRVGVTATSHKVIRNLLDEVERTATEEGLAIRCIQKVSDSPGESGEVIRETTSNEAVLGALADGEAHVAAGTAWLWAREEFFEAVEVLVIDEAGQMSLASVLAAAQAARSVILLGDPQQLEEPIQGSHPEGAAVSVLQHVLGDHDTIPNDRGLFLDESWRLHPAICEFTSETFYEGRLSSRSGLERQRLQGPGMLGTGIWFQPVGHDGNQNWSPEEVDVVAVLVEGLARGDYSWIDVGGQERPLRLDDILIVAPYNAQVYAIEDRLPGARVGTVDRFQGQEAPVVIYSMTTSSPEDAPRGMEFLYSLNRLNVATSRARGAVILVANPRIFEPECQTPRQMRLANAYCRYLELSRPLTLPGLSQHCQGRHSAAGESG